MNTGLRLLNAYLFLGVAWWLWNQLHYVEPGQPYWQGFNLTNAAGQNASDPNQIGGGILNSIETIVAWPYAAIQTTKLNAPNANAGSTTGVVS